MSFRFIRNESGVSIVQGLVLAAIIAGMAFVGTRMTTDQKLISKTVETRSKVEDLHNLVYGILQNRDHCKETFLGTAMSPGATTAITQIKTLGGGSPFRVQSGTSDMYMGNAVAINSMNISYDPAGLDRLATLRMQYGRMESDNMNRRSGKGFGGKTITKNISIKIQRKAGVFDYCYAVESGENSDLNKEFCEQLSFDGTPGNSLFVWNATNNTCDLKNLNCNPGEVYAGFDSNGQKRCRAIQDWMNFGSLIDNTSMNCPVNSTDVRFQVGADGRSVKVHCAPPAGPSCSSACDCAGGGTMVCSGGTCIDRTGACVNGEYAKGDASCRWLCNGGAWVCPAPGPMVPNSCFCTPTNGTWTYSAWTTCSGGTQTRTATCNATCGGTCGAQQPLTQTCTNCVNVTRCANWEFKFFQDYCGRTYTTRTQVPVKGYNFNGYYRPDPNSIAPNGYYDSGYNCTATVVECVDPSTTWEYWSTMSYSWPLRSRCQQNGNCVGTCGCAAGGCPANYSPGW